MKKIGQDTQCCSWHKKIQDVSFRFELLKDFDDEAVLDKEICLVWERRPSTETKPWPNARLSCAQKAVGGGVDGAFRHFRSWRVWWALR